MLCDECKKNEAVFHTKIIKNGVVRERHLCNECSKKYRAEEPMFSSFGSVDDILSSFSGFLLGDNSPQRTVCKRCGTTSDEFLKTGYVGCPDCYKAFESLMLPAIRRTQHDTRHVGKTPHGAALSAATQTKMERLRQQMAQAVEAEDFEQASRLRDELNALKNKKGGAGK